MSKEHRQQAYGKVSAASLLIALGIIYGDIGTSPLYALRAVIGERIIEPSLVYGGISCIFWTLVFQTSVKYIWLTLKADNGGEGGVFSLYALVKRYNKHLAIPTIIGATTLLADGIITPPISIASAIEGLGMVRGLEQTVTPGNMLTIGIVLGILSGLFFFQRFGTQVIGKWFGPVMTAWFSMLLIAGVAQVLRDPSIIKALNPSHAYNLLVHYPKGFWLLGAVFLCTTGAEALYSDLGHCGIQNIRISWVFVKTSLVCCYLGQGVWLLHSGSSLLEGRNPFFEMLPDWFLLPGIILATAATIIASQALISGSYTLISEAISLNFWPRVKVKQPTDLKGQIYIPSINTILWLGCTLMILYFRESSAMEAAYGFSITVAMIMTTVLLGFFLRYKLKWSRQRVFLLLICFAAIECSFFIANIAKIRERWMFLFFELFIFLVMYIWYAARKIHNRYTRFVDLGKYTPNIQELSADHSIPRFATHLVYLTKANLRHEIEERIIKSIFAPRPKRADVYWFVHIHRTSHPYTLSYEVSELVDDKVIKITVNIGFRVPVRTELYLKQIVQDLMNNGDLNRSILAAGTTKYNTENDFRFVVFHKFLSMENELSLRNTLLLNGYFLLKKMSLSEEKAFGLDKNDVAAEQVPLLYQPAGNIIIQRSKSSECFS